MVVSKLMHFFFLPVTRNWRENGKRINSEKFQKKLEEGKAGSDKGQDSKRGKKNQEKLGNSLKASCIIIARVLLTTTAVAFKNWYLPTILTDLIIPNVKDMDCLGTDVRLTTVNVAREAIITARRVNGGPKTCQTRTYHSFSICCMVLMPSYAVFVALFAESCSYSFPSLPSLLAAPKDRWRGK